MIFSAQDHTHRDTDLLEAAAARIISPSSSMIVLVRHRATGKNGKPIPGTLECMHHANLIKPGQRAGILASHGINLDESPLTALRYAFATVMDGRLAVLGNSEPLKNALWQVLTEYGAAIHRISNTEFEIIFTKVD